MEHELRGRRGHRPILGISGLTMFVCLVLPAVHTCGRDETPLEYPFAWAPYFYGLALVICACLGSPRFVRAAVVVFRGTTILFLAGGVLLMRIAIVVGVIEMAIAGALLWVLGSGARESRLALTTVVFGFGSMVWFLFWSLTPDARYGLWLSLAASITIATAGVWWRREVAADEARPDVPRAVAREI